MNFNDFAEQFDRTASPFYALGTPSERVNCALLGLISEVGEHLDAPSADELGDVMWYFAKSSKECGFSLTNLFSHADVFNPDDFSPLLASIKLVTVTAKIASLFKKSIEKDRPLVAEVVYAHFCAVAGAIRLVADKNHTALEDIMEQNIAKLTKRHPAGFNPNHAEQADALKEQGGQA